MLFNASVMAIVVVVVVMMVMVMMTVPERQRNHDVTTIMVMMMVVMMILRELHIARIGCRILLLVDCLQHRAGVPDRLQEIGIGMGL